MRLNVIALSFHLSHSKRILRKNLKEVLRERNQAVKLKNLKLKWRKKRLNNKQSLIKVSWIK